MSTFTIHFKNVGRFNKSWSEVIPNISEREIIKSLRKSGAVLSRFPDFEYDETNNEGVVLAGFRVIGTFHIDANS